jgi:hypothetical protein
MVPGSASDARLLGGRKHAYARSDSGPRSARPFSLRPSARPVCCFSRVNSLRWAVERAWDLPNSPQ